MANLFEGAPPAWLNAFGEQANEVLDNSVFDWIYNKSRTTQAPEWLGNAGEAAYQGMHRAFGQPQQPVERFQRPQYRQPNVVSIQDMKQRPVDRLRAQINTNPYSNNGI